MPEPFLCPACRDGTAMITMPDGLRVCPQCDTELWSRAESPPSPRVRISRGTSRRARAVVLLLVLTIAGAALVRLLT